MYAGVVGVLLGRSGVGTTRAVEAQEGDLDMLRRWINIEDSPGEVMPRSKWPVSMSS